MIKVLVVDDEILVRMGMKTVIPWEEYGFRLIGEASDGCEALKICEIERPDIVLTDIRMPNMDGMEFIKELKVRFKGTYFIILTCLDEVAYIKEAMMLGASGYFTKISIDREAVIRLLNGIKNEIKQHRQKESEIDELKKYINDNKLMLKERIFNELLKSRNNETEKCLKSPLVDGNACERANTLLVVELVKGIADKDEQFLKMSVLSFLEEIICKWFGQGEVFPSQKSEFCILLSLEKTKEEDYKKQLSSVQSEIKDSVGMYFNVDCQVYFIQEFLSINNLYEAYALYVEKRKGYPKIGRVKGVRDGFDAFLSENDRQLTDSIKRGDSDRAAHLLKILFNKADEYDAGLDLLKRICLQILVSCEKEIRNYGESIDSIFEDDIVGKTVGCESIETLRNITSEYVKNITEVLVQLSENKYRKEIKNIMDFVELHCKEKISLDYAAAIVNMNSAYFCRLFKKETGLGFIEYLTQVRINKAKEYLQDKAVKLFEVAEMVGYNDVTYFSKAFKKMTGISPAQFREAKRL